MDALNDVNIGIFSFVCAVVCYEVSCVSGNGWSADFDGHYPIVPGRYLKSGFNSSNCSLLGSCVGER